MTSRDKGPQLASVSAPNDAWWPSAGHLNELIGAQPQCYPLGQACKCPLLYIAIERDFLYQVPRRMRRRISNGRASQRGKLNSGHQGLGEGWGAEWAASRFCKRKSSVGEASDGNTTAWMYLMPLNCTFQND